MSSANICGIVTSRNSARSENRSDAIDSRLAKLAIEFLVAELDAERAASEMRIAEIRDAVALLRQALGTTRGAERYAA